jgi:hypothetical protein
MKDYAELLQKLVESNETTVTTVVLPVAFMLIDAWFKSWLKFDWKTYGADTALCGVATLGSAVFAAAWVSPISLIAAIFLLGFHVLMWTGVLRLASAYHHRVQAITGGLVCWSAMLFAVYYMKELKH